MEQLKQWRFDVLNPENSPIWRKLWEIEEDQLDAARELRNDLNKINAPVLVRIVRKTGF